MLVGDAVRYMPGGNDAAGRFNMPALVVKENIGPEGEEKLGLVETAKKERFVDANAPRT